nr:bacteriophage abortive infection AbiH family protein [Sphingobacterium faecale]
MGNGFDLNLGLKTSYRDFYSYYKSIESSKEGVKILKTNIADNFSHWSDLELALGQYTENFKNTDDFDEAFEDIGEQLAEYLKNEENNFDFSRANKEKLFEDLVKAEVFLTPAESKKIADYKLRYVHHSWAVDIVTFNYTRIIEGIIGGTTVTKIGNHIASNVHVELRGIDHIHGYVDDRMVLGVNDVSQLKNQKFHQNVDILEAIVKQRCNSGQGHTIDDQVVAKIKEANMIIIFGSSLGDTDNMWWELIGEKLKREPIPVIIFTRGEEVISPRIAYKNNRTKRAMVDYFLKKTKLNGGDIERVKDNIFVGLNTSMFQSAISKN